MTQQIRELMTTNPATVEAGDTADKAAKLMDQRDVGSIVVTDNGHIEGLVTDRDIVVRAVAKGKNPAECKVSDVCTSDPTTLSPDDSVDDALARMREHNVRRLPVAENGSPVGIISLGDLAVAREPESALGDISAASPNN